MKKKVIFFLLALCTRDTQNCMSLILQLYARACTLCTVAGKRFFWRCLIGKYILPSLSHWPIALEGLSPLSPIGRHWCGSTRECTPWPSPPHSSFTLPLADCVGRTFPSPGLRGRDGAQCRGEEQRVWRPPRSK
jgi:hypothetical protein